MRILKEKILIASFILLCQTIILGQVDFDTTFTPVSDNVFYVSKQTKEFFPKRTGSSIITTDRFEHGWMIFKQPSGPISWELKDVAADTIINPNDTIRIDTNTTKSWKGWIMPDISNIPEPGYYSAFIEADYDIHYSKPHESDTSLPYPPYVTYTKTTNEITAQYSCNGGCGYYPHSDSGGMHDLMHVAGNIKVKFEVHSIFVDIEKEKTFLYFDDGANLKARLYAQGIPMGGNYTWTTPDGTLNGSDTVYDITGWSIGEIIPISVTYNLHGVHYTESTELEIKFDTLLSTYVKPCIALSSPKPTSDYIQLTWGNVYSLKPHIFCYPETLDISKDSLLHRNKEIRIMNIANGVNYYHFVTLINEDSSLLSFYDPKIINFWIVQNNFAHRIGSSLQGVFSPCVKTGGFLPENLNTDFEIYLDCCNLDNSPYPYSPVLKYFIDIQGEKGASCGIGTNDIPILGKFKGTIKIKGLKREQCILPININLSAAANLKAKINSIGVLDCTKEKIKINFNLSPTIDITVSMDALWGVAVDQNTINIDYLDYGGYIDIESESSDSTDLDKSYNIKGKGIIKYGDITWIHTRSYFWNCKSAPDEKPITLLKAGKTKYFKLPFIKEDN